MGMIYRQEVDLTKLNLGSIKANKDILKISKERNFKTEFERIKDLLPSKSKKRALEQASMRGVSAWLSALPLKSLGYSLNKQDFRNSVCLRYDWNIPGIHRYCACGNKNSLDHSLTCKKGGYVFLRHNALVDTEAELLREAKCKNVQTEPPLLPTAPELHPNGTNTADGARLDIVATGLFGRCERTFMDVRVTHQNALSNISLLLHKLLIRNEKEKKMNYNSKVINTEKYFCSSCFYNCTGGVTGPEKIANIIADYSAR